jgi:tetratricopeptide (TPR) repeat protein
MCIPGAAPAQGSWPLWKHEAMFLHLKGRFGEELGIANTILDTEPECADAWLVRGRALVNLDLETEGIECLERALKLDANNADAWIEYGRAHARNPAVIRPFDRALAINPSHALAWFYKGLFLSASGKTTDAIACFDRAIDLMPTFGTSYVWKGKVLLDLKRYEEALSNLDRGLQLEPDDPELALSAKASALVFLGRSDDAITCFDTGLQQFPRNAKLWLLKGACLEQIGRTNEALECYDRSLEIKSSEVADLASERKAPLAST